MMPRRYWAPGLEEESGVGEPSERTSPCPPRAEPKSRASVEGRLASRADGNVLSRECGGSADAEDLVVMRILDLVDRDFTANPQRIGPVPLCLLARARELVKGVTVDLNAPLNPEDA